MEDTEKPTLAGHTTAPQPTSTDAALAMEVVESLSRVSAIVRDHVGDALLASNSNETRLMVMRSIAARGHQGCSQAELASVLRQAESSVCTLIERMKRDGLVHRFRSKQDRRKSFLMLTPEGQEQLEAALSRYEQAALALQSAWGRERASQLRSLLEDVEFALSRPATESDDNARRAAA